MKKLTSTVLCIAGLVALCAAAAFGQQRGISAVAGGRVAMEVTLEPSSVAVDATQAIYVGSGNSVFKIDVAGGLTVVAGRSAGLDRPQGVAADPAGNVYIADTFNSRILKVTPDGAISTLAGSGTPGYSGDGGPAAKAQLYVPWGIAVDTAGNLYIADTGNARIRKVAPNGTISTFAGTGVKGCSGDGGPAAGAQLFAPYGVAVDAAAGNLYIADSGGARVRKVAADGLISTVAGTGAEGDSGDGGPAESAQLHAPSGVAVDLAGNLYIADSRNHRIREVTLDGTISTVAGGGLDDSGDGASAVLIAPVGIAVDFAGNLYIADDWNEVLNKVTRGGAAPVDDTGGDRVGTMTTLAGGFGRRPRDSAATATPTITSLSPNSVSVGGPAFTLTVTGTALTSAAHVMWGTTQLTTTYVSATTLKAAVPSSLITAPGTVSITAKATSYTTKALTFAIQPPTITSLSPNSTLAGGPAFYLTVNGTNFVSGVSLVQWSTGGTCVGCTINLGVLTYVSATQLTAVFLGNGYTTETPGTIKVLNGATASNAAPFTIVASAPTITGLSPTTVVRGGTAFTLTVTGTNYVPGAVVKWNTTALTTTYVSATQLTAAVPATSIASTQVASITVVTAKGTSNAKTVAVVQSAPTITQLSPSSWGVGPGGFTLTVSGTNFVPGATVTFGAMTGLAATYVSPTEVTTVVPTSCCATAGTAYVSVTTINGTSNEVAFTISSKPIAR